MMANDQTHTGAPPEAPPPPRPAGSPRHRRPNRKLMVGLAAVLVVIAGAATAGLTGGSGPAKAHLSTHAPRLATQGPTTAASPGGATSPAPTPTPNATPSPNTPNPTPSPNPSPGPSPTLNPAEPSGEAMPTGNIPGWRMVFSDDFTGSSLNQRAWGAYQGQPGGDKGGWWDPSHVVVKNGVLNLESYVDPAHANPANRTGYVSGGVSSAPGLRQAFGKYLVRFRIDKGDGIAGVLLLWPSNDVWPPEIDFGEDGGGNRTRTTATLHYGTSDDQIARSVSADFSQWHTLGVEWTAGQLTFTLDGAPWATIASSEVPSENMEMDLQTQAGTCGDQINPCPDASTPAMVDMQVDWVVAYAPN
jgi:hypothetical protein